MLFFRVVYYLEEKKKKVHRNKQVKINIYVFKQVGRGIKFISKIG